jgi:hypothetical protein
MTRQSGFMNSAKVSAILCSVLLTACSGQSGSGPPSATEKEAAKAKLERMLQAKSQREAQDAAAEAERQRIAEEKAAKAAAEAAKPHYDPTRVGIAKKWRQWADITIPDLNIHAWLKSNWNDGNMHIRLALLGDKTALRLFTGNWPYFRLVFADQQGNNLHQCILATRDLHWDEVGMRNNGTPTMEFEGDSECSLEVYESIVQWNLKWEDHID